MEQFKCTCRPDQPLFFENTHCTACGTSVGYRPDTCTVEPFDIDERGVWHPIRDRDSAWLPCTNYTQYNVCNWMVPAQDGGDTFCLACSLNETIPDLSLPENLGYWARMESAKRHTLHTCLVLGLPVFSKNIDPAKGLSFRFLADRDASTEFSQPLAGHPAVMTGHDDGVITINLAEADDIARTRIRARLGEAYRTLLGHFRHEIGHYYWMLLIENNPKLLNICRELMGDDTQDYEQACARHYEQGPPADWAIHHISAYASMHPWEDWAETWAHTLHMIDSLDTARNYGLADQAPRAAEACTQSAASLVEAWTPLTISLNALNRSMGLPDAYPFVLTPQTESKLAFVHEIICATR